MFDGNDDFDLEDDFLNDVFDIEKENVNTQKTDHVEDVVLNADLSKPEGYSPHQKFVFNPRVNSAAQSSSSSLFLKNVFQETKDVSPCSSNRPEFSRNVRKPITAPVHSASKTKRQRKFPGPAGLLPDRQNVSFSDSEDALPVLDSENSCDVPVQDLCSQGPCSGTILQEEPWQQMLTDLGSQPPGREVLDTLNIASIKRKGAARLLVGRKVPFLAAILHHIDVSSADPVVVLRDHTGEMHGTLHRDVWEQFGSELTVGSVLVLRNMGVLSTGVSARRHYLNITSNNLATIYTASQGESRVSNIRPLTKSDFMKTIEDWQQMVSQTACNSPVSSSPNPKLFNSMQPLTSSPSYSLPSRPSNFSTNKLQNTNAVNIRNLAKAFNNNQYPVNPATPTCSRASSHNSSSSVNNKNKQMFNKTPVFQSENEKFASNSVPSNPSKIIQLSYNNLSKNNQLKRIETNNSGFELNSKNYVPNNMNCSFDQQSVDMFASRENTQKSCYTSHANDLIKNFKNDRHNKSSFGTGKSESCAFQPKKPRFSDLRNTTAENSKQTINLSASNITICSGSITEDEKSVVASVLDGLDEDLLFSDDF